MTLTHTQKTVKPGMTLLELTVVILVLLSLISILFVGARAWKKGSDRAANIMNLRNIQQAVRAEQNMKDLAVGGTVASTDIIGAGLYLEAATPPTASSGFAAGYTYTGTVPAFGSLYVTAPADCIPDTTYGPDSTKITGW